METLTGFQKDVHDPIEIMRHYRWPTDHITVDDTIKPDYYIRRQGGHDGTHLFTHELIQNGLRPLASKQSYWKLDAPKPNPKDVKYTITKMRIATVFGQVDLKCGRFPGQRERLWIGVKCEFIY